MADEQTANAPADTDKSNKIPIGAWILGAQLQTFGFGFRFAIAIYRLFLRNKLGFTGNEIVSITHIVSMITLFLSPIGALIVDSGGNKIIIALVGLVTAGLSNLLLVWIAIPKFRHIGRTVLYVRYGINAINAIATGSVEAPLRGNQFKLPEQQPALVKYYKLMYIIVNVIVLVAYYISPTIKTEIPCLGEQECYILGFGISVIFAIIAIAIFISGLRYYIIIKPTRNMAFDIFKCMGNGFTHWLRERKTNPRPHWLDHAEPAYGAQLVADIKRVFRLIIIFSIVPIYDAVYYQLNSKWLFQAARLDGRVGSYVIIPEHFQLLNPFLAVIMLPLCMKFLDPAIARWHMDRLFRRMIFGGTMLAIAFACAGFLESEVKKTNPLIPEANESQVRIFNGLECSCIIKSTQFLNHSIEVNAQGVYTNKHIPVEGKQAILIYIGGSCIETTEEEIYLEGGKSISVQIQNMDKKPKLNTRIESVEKTEDGLPVLTVIGAEPEDSVIVQDSRNVEIPMIVVKDNNENSDSHRTVSVVPETYKLYLNGKNILDFKMHLGGLYLIMVSGDSATFFTITEPNSVHMAWIIPQSIILIFGEVYFGIAMQEFTYSEAPMSLKSLTASIYAFASGLGDFMLVVITMFGNMDQDHEFYFYAFILFLDMGYLTFIALRFKSINEGIKLI